MDSLISSLLLYLLIFINVLPSYSNIHKISAILRETSSLELRSLPQNEKNNDEEATRYFEVARPIKFPKTSPCSSLLLQHDFGHTYGQPAVTASYSPPRNCPSLDFSKIILEWNATCKGKQFDRIFGVWLEGVELLRSCTAEPRSTGIVWTVRKDITRYLSLLKKPSQILSVYLGNLIDGTYTGVYHVNLTFHFYPAEKVTYNLGKRPASVDFSSKSHADLIVPISRGLPCNDGLWFLIENSTDTKVKKFIVPRNAYRAVLEIFVSFHSSDEFWYSNPPNDYIKKNNLTDAPGNGPFREVVVTLDDKILGAVWPFPVIYTGGINPLVWRPITGIGSFDLPSYDIEVSPFMGMILDGKPHALQFSVTNALNVWYVDANLHIWLDVENSITTGHLVKAKAVPPEFYTDSEFTGLDGTSFMSASRQISSAGWVNSSHGKIMVHVLQGFTFSNLMAFWKDGDLQIVNQVIAASSFLSFRSPSSEIYSSHVHQEFPLHLFTKTHDQGNESYLLVSNITLGVNKEQFCTENADISFSSLANRQNGNGHILVEKKLISGIGRNHQVYNYNGRKGCYFRNVSSRNYSILWDLFSEECNE